MYLLNGVLFGYMVGIHWILTSYSDWETFHVENRVCIEPVCIQKLLTE